MSKCSLPHLNPYVIKTLLAQGLLQMTLPRASCNQSHPPDKAELRHVTSRVLGLHRPHRAATIIMIGKHKQGELWIEGQRDTPCPEVCRKDKYAMTTSTPSARPPEVCEQKGMDTRPSSLTVQYVSKTIDWWSANLLVPHPSCIHYTLIRDRSHSMLQAATARQSKRHSSSLHLACTSTAQQWHCGTSCWPGQTMHKKSKMTS